MVEDILKTAKRLSEKAERTNENYAEQLYSIIDNIIIRAAEYKDVTGIFLAQVTSRSSRVFQAMYRETNSPVDREYEYTHGCDNKLVCIDDNCVTIDDIVDHYARLGFLAGVKVFEYRNYIQYRILISWSDEENLDDKVNIHKYVDGVDIFADDSHPEKY